MNRRLRSTPQPPPNPAPRPPLRYSVRNPTSGQSRPASRKEAARYNLPSRQRWRTSDTAPYRIPPDHYRQDDWLARVLQLHRHELRLPIEEWRSISARFGLADRSGRTRPGGPRRSSAIAAPWLALARVTAWPSKRASAADEIDQDHDDGDYHENVDEATHGVGSHEPEEPQYQQDNRNGIEHGMHLCVDRTSKAHRQSGRVPGRRLLGSAHCVDAPARESMTAAARSL